MFGRRSEPGRRPIRGRLLVLDQAKHLALDGLPGDLCLALGEKHVHFAADAEVGKIDTGLDGKGGERKQLPIVARRAAPGINASTAFTTAATRS